MVDKFKGPNNTKEVADKKDTSDHRLPSIPSISVPKGGGAIRGIGEKFSVNSISGTGSLSVPIFTSPGRSNFGPQLSLSYDSGFGNGPFGFGWSLSLPSITRKTDKGLPRYQDANESDVFILSGAEDLVPVFMKDTDGNWVHNRNGKPVFDEEARNGYKVRRYRPRIEGLFAIIERWTREIDGDVHWRSISKDNVLTVYGRDEGSRIAHQGRIFSWLICESYDDKGNAIVYEYAAENEKGIDLSKANEYHRERTVNRYLKRILYGNREPLLLDITKLSFRRPHTEKIDFSSVDWMFEVVFDYGEKHYIFPDGTDESRIESSNMDLNKLSLIKASATVTDLWPVRPDPFSSYRAGFEVRTYRRCFRVLMFHRFPELGDGSHLVKSTEFDYRDLTYKEPVQVESELRHKGSTRFASFIRAISQSGYVRDENEPLWESNGAKYLTYIKKSLPPLEFEYSQAEIKETVEEIDAESLENLPYGVDGSNYQFVDLDGEGLSGILTEQATAWFYKPNLGGGKFGPIETVATKPQLAALSSGRQQLLDLAGDGQLDVVMFDSTTPGFYERTSDQGWENFIPFLSLPNIFWKDPNLKFVDLTGDGHADIIITEDETFIWYPSRGEEGFGMAERVYKALNEEKGPLLVFNDGSQSIYLADMSGDGLVDLVRIRNGEVCYWPNLGYGRFGSKVTMDNAPWFDLHDQFDQKRIRLADIDGSGTTDIIYLRHDSAEIYFNQSGNRLSEARKLSSFPHIDNLSSIQVADLFGNGTACLVWSSPMACDSRRPMLYIDLMGGNKPHLLTSSKNNLGAETRVHYASSTKFYLEDKAKGEPWITRLPFPVHVVERIESYDRISRNLFVTRYAYHHGYFDGIEREFRGFGRVEQWDTEEIGDVEPDKVEPDNTNWDAASFVPPVLTQTWFHTGAYFEEERVSKHFEDEYYREGDPSLHEGQLDPEHLEAMLLPDTILPDNLTSEEAHEACRSLKGSILRQEVYALDRRPDGTQSEESDRPYTVSERNYTIKCLQPMGGNRHAVFFVHPRETIDFHYERKLYPDSQNQRRADPRVTHNVVLEVDPWGNVLKSVAIGYGRRLPDSQITSEDQSKQSQVLITYTENRYTNPIPDPKLSVDILKEYDAYRTPLQSEMRTFEVIKFEPSKTKLKGITQLFRFEDLEDLVNKNKFSEGEWDIPYEDVAHEKAEDDHSYRRVIEHIRMVYRSNELKGLLPLHSLDSLALIGETFKLAFTPGLISEVYRRKRPDQTIEDLLPNPSEVLGSNKSDGGGYVDQDGNGHWWIPSGQVFYWDQGDLEYSAAKELDFASKHFFLPHRFCDPFGNNTTIAYDSSEIDSSRNHNLLLVKTKDPLDNTVLAQNDYRVLQPEKITDPNGAVSEVLFDALSLVVATAVHKEGIGDSLQTAGAHLTQKQVDDFFADPIGQSRALLGTNSTYVVYDLNRYHLSGNTDKPPYAASIARETHVSDPVPEGGLKVQISFSFSDGFGREIQKKIQAEPGAVEGVGDDINPRWVGSGWTIFNNKGKPVRKYEPFFDNTHDFRFGREVGVSTVLFYDPEERVVATLHPNGTYEKVVFDPWHQQTFDVNDTVALDPRTDEDISGYVAGYFKQEAPQPDDRKTWLQQRGIDPLNPPQNESGLDPEKKAAVRTLIHANTPTTAYFDSLGRTILTIAHNKFKHSNMSPADLPIEEFYRTRSIFDIEGNQLEVRDEWKNELKSLEERIVMRYYYDMLSNRIRQSSMEAGERWMLNDVAGNPVRAWDSRDHQFRSVYDQLRRPTKSYLTAGTAQELLVGCTVYGETVPDSKVKNLRGKAFLVFDQAGIITNDEYDFKGNLLTSSRQLALDYRQSIDWTAVEPLLSVSSLHLQAIEAALAPLIEGEAFPSSTEYDALNRPIKQVMPDASIIWPCYNEANLLESIKVNLRGAEIATAFVNNIDYNSKGQRELIEYGNGVGTTYEYDKLTFRLTHLKTLRELKPLQNLSYTYDPSGNIIFIRDDTQQTIYFNGAVIRPDADYTYDAVYRLIQARGREHIGQASQPWTTWNDAPRTRQQNPNDGKAMRTYTEQYEYDEVGNFLRFIHHSNGGDWVRDYSYEEPSLIEPGVRNNRLSKTIVASSLESYTYDAHGSMTSMPHLPKIEWNFEDQLQSVSLGSGGMGYYVYDSGGQRVRKVIELADGRQKEERLYIGGFEVYRKYNGSSGDVKLERETLHIMDDKQRIALVETRTIDTAGNDPAQRQLIRYQFGNHLGSASLELDERAQIISYEEYAPYGSSTYQAVRSQTETAKRYRYTGMERDEESGLYYHGARYYALWLGLWCSSDPDSIEAGLNLYQYCSSNPVRFIDSSGRGVRDTLLYWSGNIVGAATAVVGYKIKRELHPSVAAGYAWAQEVFGWQESKVVQDYRNFTVNDPFSSKFMAGALGFASPLVPGKWKGDDLPESMQHTYNMMQYANSNAMTFAGGVEAFQSVPPGPPSSPALVTSTGRIVQTQTNVSTAPAPSPVIMAAATGGKKSTGEPPQGSRPTSTEHSTKSLSKAPHRGGTPSQKITRKFSGDKVPYTVTGLKQDFEAIKGKSVYVLKDSQGNVLYVGEGNVFDCLRRHVRDPQKTPWFGEIAQMEVRGTALTKKESLALEEDLIHQLNPLYNKELNSFESAYPGQLRGPDLPRPQRTLNFNVNLGSR